MKVDYTENVYLKTDREAEICRKLRVESGWQNSTHLVARIEFLMGKLRVCKSGVSVPWHLVRAAGHREKNLEMDVIEGIIRLQIIAAWGSGRAGWLGQSIMRYGAFHFKITTCNSMLDQ